MLGLEPRALGMLSKRSTNQAGACYILSPFFCAEKEKDTFNKSTQTKTEAALWVARFVFPGVSVMGVCGVCVCGEKQGHILGTGHILSLPECSQDSDTQAG